MDDKISVAKFFNLLKQYWTSNPDKSLSEIWLTLVDHDLAIDLGIYNKIEEVILSENKAYEKLQKLCSENKEIDNFFNNL
ncbi:hypothetical protein [uncultured Clostridium sp.]|uniref:hypothetical protein n=1 Tax=uncultured Clostridium sp. TaxID=59620 RepID=UPI00260F7391|nr:hypothetical protein [uncultured Clostridium sp.]